MDCKVQLESVSKEKPKAFVVDVVRMWFIGCEVEELIQVCLVDRHGSARIQRLRQGDGRLHR